MTVFKHVSRTDPLSSISCKKQMASSQIHAVSSASVAILGLSVSQARASDYTFQVNQPASHLVLGVTVY